MQWVKDHGGVEGMKVRNEEKAAILYNELDKNPLFDGLTAKEDRSLMNITFKINDDSLSEDFMNICGNAGISGIKGHRSVGGFRASTYNALEKESVELLVDVMQSFSNKHG